MQPVPHAGVALPRARLSARRLAALALLALACAGAAVAGVRVATHQRPVAPRAAPALAAGVPLQLANCAHWSEAGPAERGRLLGALASSVGGATEFGTVGTTLSVGAAQRLFDSRCSRNYASGFLLYEIYIKAAGFARMARTAAHR